MSIIAAVTCGFGGILYLPLWVGILIFCILGTLKAKEGEAYRYPVIIRFIK